MRCQRTKTEHDVKSTRTGCFISTQTFLLNVNCLYGGGWGVEREETGGLMVELESVEDVESWVKGVASIP